MSFRRTRIICTLGPASCSRGVIRELISAGMDVARINFSHGDEKSQRDAVSAVRSVAASMGRQIGLLQDLQGPKIRTGRLAGAPILLRRGDQITLTARRVVGDAHTLPISHGALVQSLSPDSKVLLADGELELRVRSIRGQDAVCTVIQGGLLGERKGVTAPSCNVRLPALTDKDRADLRLGAELGFDYVALSFVRSAEDVAACRRAMSALGWSVPLIAKLERPQALTHLEAILGHVQGVMVARGDLGVELSLAQVPAVQKDVIERANRRGVPVITATEMLESMVTSNRPTRAEASDVANAIWDGTDAVMLSQETSVGAHPVESVRAMAAICRAAEDHPTYQRTRPIWTEEGSIGAAIAHSAAAVATELGAAVIVAFTETGSTALQVSKAHPSVPILAVSPHAETLRRTCLYSGVVTLLGREEVDGDSLADKAAAAALASGLARRRDRIVIVAGIASRPGHTNLLKVVTI
ncbi:MAG: pyruvate kinase [Candidatus Dormibacteraeota bacterium]|nr:pyruvate kinase [Candidatus Dormibacteraeota bacterium]